MTEILQILHYHPLSSRNEIVSMLTNAPSDSTVKRLIAEAVRKELILVHGKGPATKYSLSPQAHVTMPLDLNTYFKDDVDERQIQDSFNFDLINEILPKVSIFTEEELSELNKAQNLFQDNLKGMTDLESLLSNKSLQNRKTVE